MSRSSETIAILGGRGMLGTDLAATCRRSGIAYKVFDLPDFDITNAEQLAEVVEDCNVIVNCAAYTSVDGAESHRELAHRVNAEAVGRLGRLAAKEGKYVLHISTDFVFDGKASDLKEKIHTICPEGVDYIIDATGDPPRKGTSFRFKPLTAQPRRQCQGHGPLRRTAADSGLPGAPEATGIPVPPCAGETRP